MSQPLRSSSTYLASTEAWSVKNASGQEYLVEIGFPRTWGDGSNPGLKQPDQAQALVPICYLTDGNSVFLTALEVLHRRLCASPAPFPESIIVSIGFHIKPNSKLLLDSRRVHDLTPPAPGCGPNAGGADEFADMIQDNVRPLVHSRLKERRGAQPGREAIYGHSFGGLLSLHLCFTRPTMFDTFIASSPSIWWLDKFILQEEHAFLEDKDNRKVAPSLWLSFGSEEEDPTRRRDEREEWYEGRKQKYNLAQMITNVLAMHSRLKKSGVLKNLSITKYQGEDHGTVIACSVSQGLTNFFEDWPYGN
ncbi:unnamed protein product [Clonostachys chloroleuca]|uniref:Uncharacterized protein n=1 Tax=Clonostachys chloroleuca TaxID=1926264 RepID=A0AA35M0T9_9HYPO|nr:unnamed protein product [Clonostachys chloroleuca]